MAVLFYTFSPRVHISRAKCSFYRRWNWFWNEENDYKRGRGAGIGFGFAISFDLNSLRSICTDAVCVHVCVCVNVCGCRRRLNRIDDDVCEKDNFQPFRVAFAVSHCCPLFVKSLLHAAHTYYSIYIQNYNVCVHAVLNHSNFKTIFQLPHHIIYLTQ